MVVVPIVLGRGERLRDGLEGMEERFEVTTTPSPSGVVHLTFERRTDELQFERGSGLRATTQRPRSEP